jgi:hypothetical protein
VFIEARPQLQSWQKAEGVYLDGEDAAALDASDR